MRTEIFKSYEDFLKRELQLLQRKKGRKARGDSKSL